MEVHFADTDKNQILERIRSQLHGRRLGDMLELEVSSSGFTLTVQKMGTSVLEFAEQPSASGVSFKLVKEKLAFSHRPFRGEVTEKLTKLIERSGGTVRA